jgi:hypothetical protein
VKSFPCMNRRNGATGQATIAVATIARQSSRRCVRRPILHGQPGEKPFRRPLAVIDIQLAAASHPLLCFRSRYETDRHGAPGNHSEVINQNFIGELQSQSCRQSSSLPKRGSALGADGQELLREAPSPQSSPLPPAYRSECYRAPAPAGYRVRHCGDHAVWYPSLLQCQDRVHVDSVAAGLRRDQSDDDGVTETRLNEFYYRVVAHSGCYGLRGRQLLRGWQFP